MRAPYLPEAWVLLRSILPCPVQPSDPQPSSGPVRDGIALTIPDTTLLFLSFLPPCPYPFLCPLAPRKGSWLADKVKRLMRPRREGAPLGGPRLGADGAGSTDSLGAPLETELPQGREADGTGGSAGQVSRRSLLHVVPSPTSAILPGLPHSPLAFPAACPLLFAMVPLAGTSLLPLLSLT